MRLEITEKEKELYEAKIRRFYRTLDKIVEESRKNFVLPDAPNSNHIVNELRDVGRKEPNEETLKSITEILDSQQEHNKE